MQNKNNSGPKMEALTKDTNYAWCSCGNSADKVWCNGSHKGSSNDPLIFKAEEDKTAAICTCKQTSNPPYCDGSHNKL